MDGSFMRFFHCYYIDLYIFIYVFISIWLCSEMPRVLAVLWRPTSSVAGDCAVRETSVSTVTPRSQRGRQRNGNTAGMWRAKVGESAWWWCLTAVSRLCLPAVLRAGVWCGGQQVHQHVCGGVWGAGQLTPAALSPTAGRLLTHQMCYTVESQLLSKLFSDSAYL